MQDLILLYSFDIILFYIFFDVEVARFPALKFYGIEKSLLKTEFISGFLTLFYKFYYNFFNKLIYLYY